MKYYNTETGEIVDYPEEAAALFPVLKPVPSDKKVRVSVEDKMSEPKKEDSKDAK